MDLSIIIPAFEEEGRLPATLATLREYMDGSDASVEVVLVDDASTDRTREIVQDASRADARVRAVMHPVNRGKGASVRDGLLEASGDVCLFTDADLAYGLGAVPDVLDRVGDGADMVIGARDLSQWDSRWRYSPARRAATAGFHLLVQWLVPVGVPDTQCGFKAVRRDVGRELARAMTVEGFAFDIEMLLIARLWSLRIDRIPVDMSQSQGSSIRLMRDSARMGRDLMSIRLNALRGRYPARPGRL